MKPCQSENPTCKNNPSGACVALYQEAIQIYRGLPQSTDLVTLLSEDEAGLYFSNDAERKCIPTDYARQNGAAKDTKGNCCWWLRSQSPQLDRNMYVTGTGRISTAGEGITRKYYTVRPVIRINLSEKDIV